MPQKSLSLSSFPTDPLEGVGGDIDISIFSDSQMTFEAASRDFLHQRPLFPHSDMIVSRKNTQEESSKKFSASNLRVDSHSPPHFLGSNVNQHKLEQLPPKSDPYELVKLCRQGWTLSKVI
jgi:hypothetical protein